MEEVEFIRGEKVIFVQASKFSQYSVYSNSPLAAGEAELKLVARNDAPRGQAWFDVVLAGADNATIKGFISGEFTITPANTDASFEYELTWADEDQNKEIAINYTALDGKENGAREYNIHVNKFDKATSYTVVDGVSEIKLAKLVVTAYGAGEFELSDSLLVMPRNWSS